MRAHPLSRFLRLYLVGAWYSYRALNVWITPVSYISAKLVYPLFQLLLFLLMGRFAGLKDPLYIVIGNILLLPALNGVMGVSNAIGNERQYRTLPYLLGSPAPRVPLFLGRTLFNIVDSIFVVISAFLIAVLLFGLDLSGTNLGLLAACILLITVTSTGMGLILGSVSLLTREGWTITTVVYLAFFIFCGVNFPVGTLPAPLQAISYSLPLTRGIEAARQALGGAGWSAMAPLFLGELIVGVVYAILGLLLFKFIERRSLVTGQIEAI